MPESSSAGAAAGGKTSKKAGKSRQRHRIIAACCGAVVTSLTSECDLLSLLCLAACISRTAHRHKQVTIFCEQRKAEDRRCMQTADGAWVTQRLCEAFYADVKPSLNLQ
jgi:hypothetical protein